MKSVSKHILRILSLVTLMTSASALACPERIFTVDDVTGEMIVGEIDAEQRGCERGESATFEDGKLAGMIAGRIDGYSSYSERICGKKTAMVIGLEMLLTRTVAHAPKGIDAKALELALAENEAYQAIYKEIYRYSFSTGSSVAAADHKANQDFCYPSAKDVLAAWKDLAALVPLRNRR